MQKKIIYFFEIIIIIIGRIISINSTKLVFYKSFFITFIELILTFIIVKNFSTLYLKNKRNYSNKDSFTTLIVTIVLALIIGSSVFSLIDDSIIFLVNKKSETECTKIINKEISRIHGISYYYELYELASHKDVKIRVSEKTYNDFKEGQYIKVKYYSADNLIRYLKYDKIFVSCHLLQE